MNDGNDSSEFVTRREALDNVLEAVQGMESDNDAVHVFMAAAMLLKTPTLSFDDLDGALKLLNGTARSETETVS